MSFPVPVLLHFWTLAPILSVRKEYSIGKVGGMNQIQYCKSPTARVENMKANETGEVYGAVEPRIITQYNAHL